MKIQCVLEIYWSQSGFPSSTSPDVGPNHLLRACHGHVKGHFRLAGSSNCFASPPNEISRLGTVPRAVVFDLELRGHSIDGEKQRQISTW